MTTTAGKPSIASSDASRNKRARPEVIAIIPARGGSERIPRKNLVPICGRPLIVHSIEHARAAKSVGRVYVSTDDDDIATVSREAGAEVIRRPQHLSTAEASSESALLDALDQHNAAGLPDPDLIVFLQCTSPVRRPDDIDCAIETLLAAEADSLFSACENKNFIWVERGGTLASVNYDFRHRRREQELERQFRENGSIYVFKPALLRAEGNRLGGKIAVFEMDYWSSFQVDSADDVALVQWVLGRPEFQPKDAWPNSISLVVFDFDGVMTDNAVFVDDRGGELVRCLRADGLGVEALQRASVPAMVLSTETHPVVSARCAKLKLPCHQGIGDKGAFLRQYLVEAKIDPAHVVFVGNDVNDLSCFELVGFPVAVADAHPLAKSKARLVLSARGGEGAVRELCDRVLAAMTGHSRA